MTLSDLRAFAPHGFFGIDDQVVTAAANWIKRH
jgi:hypothetical protein